ncbi:MAG: CCA tRNA nucleotidyltransferase [Candidatus Sungbacteria bacterium]|uniref:CCA tRNA nucleotidyltransferase n=1 Tax=Candidatus Sungiibacteriota bacterium TaxID=2750080 RepID=A0A9D6QRW5_9BACT|nr:CCA tRNA nucleotidyltransferase [Candidatus Sungbacteria bacterium]
MKSHNKENKNFVIPKEVSAVLRTLQENDFEAYIVGGSVRDLLIGKTPGDWDVTTNASPEEIVKLFPDSFYANKFFTVTVKTKSDDPRLAEIEVTTYRSEAGYTDQRHPDAVRPAKSLEEDLSRRDFTINAIALEVRSEKLEVGSKSNLKPPTPNLYHVIDPFGGMNDLEAKIVRTVGDAKERFSEDALRMLRAVRIATELDFTIEEKTSSAIKEHAGWLRAIAKERIRDELLKMFASPNSAQGIQALHDLGLLSTIMPELEEGLGVGQNKHHVYTVWEHNVFALQWADKEKYSVPVKISALLHDVAKPRCKRGEGPDSTFYQHDVVGAKMATNMLETLHFPREEIITIAKLIRWHLFKYDPDEGITDSAIRRLIRNVGAENIADLVLLRICDRMGSGVPKAVPYRLRHFKFRVEKILREEEAPSPKMLKVNGEDVMEILGIEPGPQVGFMLAALLEEVIDDPTKNSKDILVSRVRELGQFSIDELKKLAESAESKVELIEDEREQEIKNKYYVQ